MRSSAAPSADSTITGVSIPAARTAPSTPMPSIPGSIRSSTMQS
ncbi:hypothetical protein J2Y58_003365 [Sphingomonas sp. BE138]|nr:hypothetical protein [Sphingomonas sp. BE138]